MEHDKYFSKNRNNKRIGFFDSGIGGLNVLKEALKLLPGEDYIYFADSFHAPYGIKPKEEVKEYILEAAEFLVQAGIKALVVACNTAASVAIRDLREKYDFPIIGMEPAVKPAVENKENDKRILVLATPLTLKEEKFQNLVAKVDNRHRVDSLALPELVDFAENFIFSEEAIFPYLNSKFSTLNINLYGTVVLGCTHFPFYRNIFRKVLPQDMDIIDGSLGTVRHLKNTLEAKSLINQKAKGGDIVYYASGREIKENAVLLKYKELLSMEY